MRLDDEIEFRAAHEAMQDEFPFGLFLDEAASWMEYIALLDALRAGSVDGRVRSDLLVAEVDGVIVGRISLRYELDDFLAHEGGHIGSCVLSQHRRRGYATEILRESTVESRDGVLKRRYWISP